MSAWEGHSPLEGIVGLAAIQVTESPSLSFKCLQINRMLLEKFRTFKEIIIDFFFSLHLLLLILIYPFWKRGITSPIFVNKLVCFNKLVFLH